MSAARILQCLLVLGAAGTRGPASATGASAAGTWFLLRLLGRFLLCRLLLGRLRGFGLLVLSAPGAGFAASPASGRFLLGASGTLLATSTTGSLDLRRQCHSSYQTGDAEPCHHVFDLVLIHLLTPSPDRDTITD